MLKVIIKKKEKEKREKGLTFQHEVKLSKFIYIYRFNVKL